MCLRLLLAVLVSAVLSAAPKAPDLDPVADIKLSFTKGQLQITPPEGTHLNRDFMDVKLPQGTPGRLKVGPLPPSEKDEFGSEIWRGTVRIPLSGEGLKGEVPISVTYQPCTEGRGGVCYPPTEQVLKVKASEIPAPPKAQAEMAPSLKTERGDAPSAATVQPSTSPGAAPAPPSPAPRSRNLFWIFLGLFGFGMAASLTPCVYPMIPIILAIVGVKGTTKGKGLALSTALVLGMATTYTLLGVIAARAGAVFGAFAQRPAFLIPVSILFAIFAISLFGAFEIQLPEALRAKLQGSGSRGGYLGAFLMGLVLGPLSAPCVAPVIGTVLVAIAQEGRVVLGALQLFTFALGMGVLFMIVGLSSTLLPRSGPWLIKLKQAMGVVVLAFAAWNVRLVVPEWLNPAMWAVALLATAALLDAFKKPEGFAASISKGLGLLALALAILLGVRAVESGLRLELLPRTSASAAPKDSLWMQQDFEGAIARAKTEHKLVLVDTYAQWCAQCKELDEKTWPEPRLQEWIQRSAVAIRIDADKVRPDIATRFKISGFPTVLLLDEEGRELRRFVGFQGPAEMLAFLEGR